MRTRLLLLASASVILLATLTAQPSLADECRELGSLCELGTQCCSHVCCNMGSFSECTTQGGCPV